MVIPFLTPVLGNLSKCGAPWQRLRKRTRLEPVLGGAAAWPQANHRIKYQEPTPPSFPGTEGWSGRGPSQGSVTSVLWWAVSPGAHQVVILTAGQPEPWRVCTLGLVLPPRWQALTVTT